MNGEALAALELPAITGRLAAASATELGAERAVALLPATETAEVVARQALTAEAVALLDAAQEPSLAGIADVRDTASPELRRLRRELRNGGARVREELARVARLSDVQEALQEQFLAERG